MNRRNMKGWQKVKPIHASFGTTGAKSCHLKAIAVSKRSWCFLGLPASHIRWITEALKVATYRWSMFSKTSHPTTKPIIFRREDRDLRQREPIHCHLQWIGSAKRTRLGWKCYWAPPVHVTSHFDRDSFVSPSPPISELQILERLKLWADVQDSYLYRWAKWSWHERYRISLRKISICRASWKAAGFSHVQHS